MTFSFRPGSGSISADGDTGLPVTTSGQLVLLPQAAPVAAVPAIATRAFLQANDMDIGAVVPVTINGASVPLRIVAEVAAFPTVTAPGGALVTDLGGLQEYLARQSASPLPVTQWWLATAGGGVPAALTASVPAGTGITSAAGSWPGPP